MVSVAFLVLLVKITLDYILKYGCKSLHFVVCPLNVDWSCLGLWLIFTSLDTVLELYHFVEYALNCLNILTCNCLFGTCIWFSIALCTTRGSITRWRQFSRISEMSCLFTLTYDKTQSFQVLLCLKNRSPQKDLFCFGISELDWLSISR